MLTHEKLKVYARYKGNLDNWIHTAEAIRNPNRYLPAPLQDGDWVLIMDGIHHLHLIDNGLLEESYAKKLEGAVADSCEDASVVQGLRDLIPYQHGLWDQKSSPERFSPKRLVDWVFHLFN